MSREQLTGGLLRTGWDRGLLAMVGFSLALHVVLVALLVVVRPWSEARSAPPAEVYTVELTSFTTLGSNAVPGAPGERLTGGRAEPAPPKKRAAPKPPPEPPVQVASKTPPQVEPAPIKIPPSPAPPKVEPPPVAADEPVPAPEPPRKPEPPAPAPKVEAKAPEPAPVPEPEVQPDEPSEVPETAAVDKVAAPEEQPENEPEEAAEKKPEVKPEVKAKEPPKPQPEKQDEQVAQKQPEPQTQQVKQPAQPQKPVTAAKQPAAPAEPSQDAAQADDPAGGAEDATADAGGEAADAEDTRYAAAIDRIRRRVETGAGGLMGDGDAGATPAVGAAGPGGGNRVVGAEFLIYYNIMLSHIKQSWLWVGHDDTLIVTVRFQVGHDGAIRDIRLEQASGDATYDESVVRAVEQANPLPPPPEAHRSDFGDVKLTFRPGDLRQPG